MIEKNKQILSYGIKAEDEYLLVGTEEGLQRLITACQEALEKGESTKGLSSDIEGVKKVDETYWEDENETGMSWVMSRVVAPVIMIFFIISLFVGAFTIIKWFAG